MHHTCLLREADETDGLPRGASRDVEGANLLLCCSSSSPWGQTSQPCRPDCSSMFPPSPGRRLLPTVAGLGEVILDVCGAGLHQLPEQASHPGCPMTALRLPRGTYCVHSLLLSPDLPRVAPQDRFCSPYPQGIFGSVWRHLGLSCLGRAASASNGQRLGTLPRVPQPLGHPHDGE